MIKNPREMCNTITFVCTLIVFTLVGLIFILVYFASPLINMPDFRIRSYSTSDGSAKLNFLFDKFVDKKWSTDLWHHLIYQKVENDFTNFTKNAAICQAVCNADDEPEGTVFYEKECNTFPLLIKNFEPTDTESTKNATNSRSRLTYAIRTVPCFLTLDTSTVPGAGRGIFTTKYKLPRGLLFGPYKGNILKTHEEDAKIGKRSAYAWRIWNSEHNAMVYIDGQDDTKSNWLRYVNSARFYEEQNLVPLIFKNSVYYLTFKDVDANTELLVWYGQTFAKFHLTKVIKTSKHDWGYFFAPPVNETICPTCPITHGEERSEDFEYNYTDYLFELFHKCSLLLLYLLFISCCYFVIVT